MMVSMTFANILKEDLSRYWPAVSAILLLYLIRRALSVPKELAHLPKVPVLPTIWSYVKGEVEDVRIKKLVLPFANEKGEGVVLLYAFGRWIVHVLDHKVILNCYIYECACFTYFVRLQKTSRTTS